MAERRVCMILTSSNFPLFEDKMLLTSAHLRRILTWDSTGESEHHSLDDDDIDSSDNSINDRVLQEQQDIVRDSSAEALPLDSFNNCPAILWVPLRQNSRQASFQGV